MNSPVPDRPQLPPLDLAALRLPVFAEAFEGLGDVRGLLLFDGRMLRFDFQTADALFGLIRSGAKQLEVPLSAIAGVRRGLGWFWLRPYIELELNDFSLLSKVPGSHRGSWRLRVRFADRHQLRRFADALSFACSRNLHEVLERSLRTDPQLDLPPLQPESAQPAAADQQQGRRTEVQ